MLPKQTIQTHTLIIICVIYHIMKRRKYSETEFICAVTNSYSIAEVLNKLGLAHAGGSYKTFYATVRMLKLDISHFKGKGHLKNKSNYWVPKIALEKILVFNSSYSNTSKLKMKLIKANIFKDICSICKIDTWQGEKLSLHLDHIDGNNTNNLIENLGLVCVTQDGGR